jgi:hypothetical protein
MQSKYLFETRFYFIRAHILEMQILDQANILLDFNQKLDISLLDNVINLMYTGHGDVVSFLNSDFILKGICLNMQLFFFY